MRVRRGYRGARAKIFRRGLRRGYIRGSRFFKFKIIVRVDSIDNFWIFWIFLIIIIFFLFFINLRSNGWNEGLSNRGRVCYRTILNLEVFSFDLFFSILINCLKVVKVVCGLKFFDGRVKCWCRRDKVDGYKFFF